MTCLAKFEQTLALLLVYINVVRTEAVVAVKVKPSTYEAVTQTIVTHITLDGEVYLLALLNLEHMVSWVTIVSTVSNSCTAMIIKVTCCTCCRNVSHKTCLLSCLNAVSIFIKLAGIIQVLRIFW